MLAFDLVLDQVFVGTAPNSASDVRRLRRSLGVTAVLNLQTDADFDAWRIDWATLASAYEQEGIVVERWPIRDFDGDDLVARMAGAVERLDRLLDVGHRVYLHCTAGQQRSPAVAVAWLIRCEGLALDAALARVSEKRACAPDVDALARLFPPSDTGGSTSR